MHGMFWGATSFDQSLASWDIAGADTLLGMLWDTGISPMNYSRTLVAWAKLTGLQPNVNLGSSAKYYCWGADARAALTKDESWTIDDAGVFNNCDFVAKWQTDAAKKITLPLKADGT